MRSKVLNVKRLSLVAMVLVALSLIFFLLKEENKIGAGDLKNDYSTAPQSTPDIPDSQVERKITSDDILKINKGMTYSEIKSMLGNTYSYTRANEGPDFYSYIVDDNMRYTQLFGDSTDVCELSGDELLEKIKEENTEVAHCFIDPKLACEEMKTAIFETDGWHIIFANESFVYAAYSEYPVYILRYNIETNSIDKALDVRGFRRFFPDIYALFNFTPDGRYMIIRNQINWTYGNTIVERLKLPFPSMYVYEIDFSECNVSLLSKTQENWSVPDGYNYSLQFDSKYTLKMDEKGKYQFYNGNTQIELNGMGGYSIDGYAYVKISEDLFAVMLYPEDKAGYLGYYSFGVINIKDGKLVSKFAINK